MSEYQTREFEKFLEHMEEIHTFLPGIVQSWDHVNRRATVLIKAAKFIVRTKKKPSDLLTTIFGVIQGFFTGTQLTQPPPTVELVSETIPGPIVLDVPDCYEKSQLFLERTPWDAGTPVMVGFLERAHERLLRDLSQQAPASKRIMHVNDAILLSGFQVENGEIKSPVPWREMFIRAFHRKNASRVYMTPSGEWVVHTVTGGSVGHVNLMEDAHEGILFGTSAQQLYDAHAHVNDDHGPPILQWTPKMWTTHVKIGGSGADIPMPPELVQPDGSVQNVNVSVPGVESTMLKYAAIL